MKKLIYLTLSAFLLSIGSACKKEDMSKYATQDDLSNNKIENISLTIRPTDWTWNALLDQWEYAYPHSYIGNGAVLGFYQGINGKEAMPYYDAQSGVTFGLTDDSVSGSIYITYYNGSESLAAPTTNQYVYLKIIPSQLKKPNIDHADFEEVNAAY
ncbi:MAG TPA: hypothetical protein VL946_08405 [Lacibacter sp.]|nr:hypothetical protein [Lacibacter sp.]